MYHLISLFACKFTGIVNYFRVNSYLSLEKKETIRTTTTTTPKLLAQNFGAIAVATARAQIYSPSDDESQIMRMIKEKEIRFFLSLSLERLTMTTRGPEKNAIICMYAS